MPFFLQRIFKPLWEKYLTLLLYGPRSQGKSLHQAKLARQIFKYLDNLYFQYPNLPQAIVVSNQLFSKEFEMPYLVPRPVKKGKTIITHQRRLYYWESIQQLKKCPRENCWKGKEEHVLHDAYIIFDDIATIIPADGWQDLPKWFRKVFAQAGHNAVHCIANIQDPVSCDINFRRYVDVAIKFKKVIGNPRPEASKPPIKTIWGFYMTWRVSAEELWKYGDMTEYDIKKLKEGPDADRYKQSWIPRFHLITRKATEIYDTTQNVPEYMPNSMEHIEYKCTNVNCKFIHVKHRVI